MNRLSLFIPILFILFGSIINFINASGSGNIIIQFRFISASEDQPSEKFILYGTGREFRLSVNVEIDQNDFECAEGDEDEYGRYCISFRLNSAGTEKLFQLTGEENRGKKLGIVIDGRLVSINTIKEQISGGRGRITGRFTQQWVMDIINRINKYKSVHIKI